MMHAPSLFISHISEVFFSLFLLCVAPLLYGCSALLSSVHRWLQRLPRLHRHYCKHPYHCHIEYQPQRLPVLQHMLRGFHWRTPCLLCL